MDHGFTRPKEPWELSDGAVFLLREISKMDENLEFVKQNFESLSSLASIDHFRHSHFLKENVFKSILAIVKTIGKKPFRPYVEIFLDPTFRAGKNKSSQNVAFLA
jgi:hypothetical protein